MIQKDGCVTFQFRRKHLDHAKAMMDVRKWLMSKIVSAVFGDRLQVDANHTFESKDDAELVHALRDAARKAGMAPKDVAALLDGQTPIQ
ncbi:hypothetical protein A9Q94_15755 [Rhodobacterales bacterium 56_14_T64]|nr:hypothetical protein A9Q94_15755 [Rhodobacterales bacterium 56_14_T64]